MEGQDFRHKCPRPSAYISPKREVPHSPRCYQVSFSPFKSILHPSPHCSVPQEADLVDTLAGSLALSVPFGSSNVSLSHVRDWRIGKTVRWKYLFPQHFLLGSHPTVSGFSVEDHSCSCQPPPIAMGLQGQVPPLFAPWSLIHDASLHHAPLAKALALCMLSPSRLGTLWPHRGEQLCSIKAPEAEVITSGALE